MAIKTDREYRNFEMRALEPEGEAADAWREALLEEIRV